MAMVTHKWVERYGELHPAFLDYLKTDVLNSVQFDCGDTDEIPIANNRDYLGARAPFPITLLQFETPPHHVSSHILVLWCEQDEFSDILTIAQKMRGGDWRTSMPFKVVRNDVGFRYEIPGFEQNEHVKKTIHAMALNLFCVLNCSNVATIDHAPPAALNKKRTKAGKFPVLSHKTLVVVVDEKKSSGQPMGGTHSSPRVHLRRGHIRSLPSGKRVWVQSCVVGSKHGMVTKDYRVTTKAALQKSSAVNANY